MLHHKARAEHDQHGPLRRRDPIPATTRQSSGQPWHGWTVVLRRQPTRLVDGQPQGGYTDAFELICCDCGDDPELDYRGTSPEFRQIRGPYPIAAGIAAYEQHVRRHA